MASRGAVNVVCALAIVVMVGAMSSTLCMSAVVEVVNASLSSVVGEAKAGKSGVAPARGSPEYLALFVEETRWYNDLVLGPWLPSSVRDAIPHTLQTWLRNYVAGLILYFVSGGLWCLYVYSWKGEHFFPAG